MFKISSLDMSNISIAPNLAACNLYNGAGLVNGSEKNSYENGNLNKSFVFVLSTFLSRILRKNNLAKWRIAV